ARPHYRAPHDGCNHHRLRDEAYRAGRLRTQSADVADCRRDPFERGTKLCEQALSRVRRRDAAGRAREEAQSQTLLERAYRVADRGPADAELESSLREAPLVRHDRERRSEEHTSELQSRVDIVCRLLLEKKKVYGS